MVALYFILNVKYPEAVSLSLESIQRYILKIHPEMGTKSTKNITGKRRVLNFLAKRNKNKKVLYYLIKFYIYFILY